MTYENGNELHAISFSAPNGGSFVLLLFWSQTAPVSQVKCYQMDCLECEPVASAQRIGPTAVRSEYRPQQIQLYFYVCTK